MTWLIALFGIFSSVGLASGKRGSSQEMNDREEPADPGVGLPFVVKDYQADDGEDEPTTAETEVTETPEETPEQVPDGYVAFSQEEIDEQPEFDWTPEEVVETDPGPGDEPAVNDVPEGENLPQDEPPSEPETVTETEGEKTPEVDAAPPEPEVEQDPVVDKPGIPVQDQFDGALIAEADFIVSVDGNDSGSGSLDDPLATIDRAVALAQPGDTILVRGGVYEGVVSIWKGGEEGAPLSIIAYPGERPVIDGSGTPANTDLVSITDSHVHFEGFEVMGATRTGISVWSSDNVTISDNIIHDTVRGGIWIGSDRLGVSHSHLVEGNDVYNTVLENEATNWSEGWARAIAVDVSTDTIVRDNAVFKNFGEGIGALSSSDLEYVDNIIYDNYSVQMYFDNAQNVTAEGNILFHTGDEDFFRNDEPGIGMLIANEYTSFEMATIGMMVHDNVFAGVEPVFYDDSYGWGGGISDSSLGPNTVLTAEDVDPEWRESEFLLF